MKTKTILIYLTILLINSMLSILTYSNTPAASIFFGLVSIYTILFFINQLNFTKCQH